MIEFLVYHNVRCHNTQCLKASDIPPKWWVNYILYQDRATPDLEIEQYLLHIKNDLKYNHNAEVIEINSIKESCKWIRFSSVGDYIAFMLRWS